MAITDIKNRTRWAINRVADEKGLSNKTLSPMFGVSVHTINNYRTKKKVPKDDFIKKFSELFGYSEEWFFYCIGEPFPGARQKYKEVCGPELSLAVNESRGEYGDYVYVPQMTGQISAGGGLVPDDRIDVRIAFRRAWIQRKGDPGKMSLVKVSGDSMEPTLLPGDLVLINHDRSYVDPQGGIYAIAVNNEIMIKRIHIVYPDGKVRIISDNRKYEPMEVETEKVHINGKVIWYGREIER